MLSGGLVGVGTGVLAAVAGTRWALVVIAGAAVPTSSSAAYPTDAADSNFEVTLYSRDKAN